MNNDSHRAIIVIGDEDPAEAAFEEAERYDEVFVIARAVADPRDRWLIDERRNRARALARLTRALARLRAHSVRAFGAIGDENAAAARNDARALFPAAEAVTNPEGDVSREIREHQRGTQTDGELISRARRVAGKSKLLAGVTSLLEGQEPPSPPSNIAVFSGERLGVAEATVTGPASRWC